MTKATAVGAATAIVLVSLGLFVGLQLLRQDAGSGDAIPVAPVGPSGSTVAHSAPTDVRGFLYGRVTTHDGATYDGRLRWGGSEEAFWGDAFNGTKLENPWIASVDPGALETRRSDRVFGGIFNWKGSVDPERPFMARFGDIVRIEAHPGRLEVLKKGGGRFAIDRMDADDLADGIRVWDATHGVVDLEERQIRSIEFRPTPPLDDVPYRLHGTVRTRQGTFSGFLQWNREKCVGTDELYGHGPDGLLAIRFDTIATVERASGESAAVTLLDGRTFELSDTRDVGRKHRGIYVDDPRYGRVLVSWNAFERADFDTGGSGPAYDEFPASHALTGEITTRDGRRLQGVLVFDLDESDASETLDAPAGDIDYILPFGRVASIELAGLGAPVRVTLHGGEELALERSGDLDERNGGMLAFVDGTESPVYVPWAEVVAIRFDAPPA